RLKFCSVRLSANRCISGTASGSLPSRTFMASSQADAALTRTSALSAPTAARALGDRRGSPIIHHSSACVSKRIAIVSLPLERAKLLLRQRIEKAFRHLELASVGAEPAFRGLARNRRQTRNRRFAVQDDDLLARRRARDEAGEMRLGGMNCEI